MPDKERYVRWLRTRDGRELPVSRVIDADREALVAFNASLSERSRYLFLPHQYDEETLDRLMQRSEAGDDIVFAVWDGDAIVGYYFLWYAKRPVCLLGIGFTDSHQGQGLGRQAMSHLIEVGRENDKDGIELTTDLTNEVAFELYKKMGFRYLHDVENMVGDGNVRIERAMFLPLKEGAEPMTEPHAPPV